MIDRLLCRCALLSCAALCVGAAIVTIGCSAPAGGDADIAATPADQAVSTDPAYPAPYRELRLPIVPGAQVMSTGREEASGGSGLSLRITTGMPVQAARQYFSDALEATGWSVTASRPLPGINVANLTATKNTATYSATFTSDGSATQIDVTVAGL